MSSRSSSADASSSVSSSVPSGQAAPKPVVRGNLLLDSRTGEQFIPRGVNWGTFEYLCAQGRGYSELDALPYADPAGRVAHAIRAWGVNTVRLPLNEDCWLGTRDAPVSDQATPRTAAGYRAAVQGFVQALNAQGIVVILDLQSRKRIGSDQFGNVAMPDAQSLDFWAQVAAAYASDPSVMFDAFNEPYSPADASGARIFDLTWTCWRDGGCTPPVEDDPSTANGATYRAVGMAQVVTTIRAAGATQPILLSGLDYANDLSRWLQYAPADTQLVAAFHSYDFASSCSKTSCWDSVLAPLAQRVPVLTSELGANDPTDGYVSTYLDWADAHGVGALFWVWGEDPSMALATDEVGTPTPYGKLARTWLLGK